MSQNKIHDLIASVDNGLQIAEFVQKNREDIQKSGGVSSIAVGSSTTESAQTKNERRNPFDNRNGSILRDDAVLGIEEESSEGYNGGLGQAVSNLSFSDQDIGGPIDHGNNKVRDAENNNDESVGGWDDTEWDSESDAGAGGAESLGDREPERSDQVHDKDIRSAEKLDDNDGSDGTQIRVPRKIEVKDPDDLDEQVLDSLLNEQPASDSLQLRSMSTLDKLVETKSDAPNPIKKGTEESMSSMSSTVRPSSESGATQSVHPLPRNLLSRSVSAGNAQRPVSTASANSSETLSIASEDIAIKIDTILQNQQNILERLNMLSELREEVSSIKKVLHNFGLSLSTVESYMNSLMIIIPKYGVPPSSQGKETNPDLRMVVGRDQRRGLKDDGVLKTKEENEKFGEDLYRLPEFDTKMFLDPIQEDKNHAAKFVPSENNISFRIVKELIRQRVKDETMRKNLIKFAEESKNKIPIKTIHTEINDLLTSMGL